MPTLLYHTGALGDFITVLPTLSVWKSNHPGDPLTLMGRPEIGSFARETGCIESAVDVTGARYVPLFIPGLSTETAEILKPYSRAIIFSAGDSPLIAHCRNRGLDVCDQPPFPSPGTHAVDYHLSLFIDPQAVPKPQKIPRIRVPQAAHEASFSLVGRGEKFCVLHAGSGSAKKNWPFERFVQTADMLKRQGKNIVWIRGPAEADLQFPDSSRVVGNPRLAVLAALLHRAELFIGNDSGVAHLAAAAGCPALVMFGPSDPRVWSPRGDRVRVLYKKASCSPCHITKRGPQVCGRTCMEGITIDDVFSSLAGFVTPARRQMRPGI